MADFYHLEIETFWKDNTVGVSPPPLPCLTQTANSKFAASPAPQ